MFINKFITKSEKDIAYYNYYTDSEEFSAVLGFILGISVIITFSCFTASRLHIGLTEWLYLLYVYVGVSFLSAIGFSIYNLYAKNYSKFTYNRHMFVSFLWLPFLIQFLVEIVINFYRVPLFLFNFFGDVIQHTRDIRHEDMEAKKIEQERKLNNIVKATNPYREADSCGSCGKVI